MTFRTLGEVLQTLSAQGMIDGLGEDTVGAASLRPKRTDPEGPAKFTELRQSGGKELDGASKAHMRHALRLISSRCKPVHDPRRAPPRRTGFHLQLVWDNGHVTAPRQRLAART